ncbi:Helix-turn-helix domain-containing protein [Rhodococcus erythropolis]|uniref:helix-turn-helix domain-containing protein n=1 Tax=Rhodococcus erythropolis TaxID=1833 RepID=UPI0008771D49|nr:helix-turn-helix transcriptional regulator [Rhodococcus erythropolis]SCZ14017.1 Helix-turn-helix domain-containing protein [Rhodococcus erythropolis]
MTTAANISWRPADTLANRFKLIRADLGMSQREFGDRVGIPASQVQSIEDGSSPRGLDIKVKKIALALGVDRDWLMWGGSLGEGPTNGGPDGGDTVPSHDNVTYLTAA